MKIELLEILRGQQGKTFFSPEHGNMTYRDNTIDEGVLVALLSPNGSGLSYKYRRFLVSKGGLWNLYPSRELYTKYPFDGERAWKEWESKRFESVKTWEELVSTQGVGLDIGEKAYLTIDRNEVTGYSFDSPLSKSALALMKIRTLIDLSYGGNPPASNKCNDLYFFVYEYCGWSVVEREGCYDPVAFYTREQANEFLRHASNQQLLNEYYMI